MSHKGILKSSLYESPEKQERRQWLFDNHPNPRRFLTLGGFKLVCVKNFLHNHAGLVDCIERDQEIWKLQIQQQDISRAIRFYNMDSAYFIKNVAPYTESYDIMFLDFNRIWSRRLESELSDLMKLHLKKNCIIGLTIVKGRDNSSVIKGTRLLNDACCGIPDRFFENRENIIASTFWSIAKENGHIFRLLNEKNICYKNTDIHSERGSTPMMFFLFKKVNE